MTVLKRKINKKEKEVYKTKTKKSFANILVYLTHLYRILKTKRDLEVSFDEIQY